MRIRPLVYFILLVLAVFSLPNDTFANDGDSPEQVSPQPDTDKETSIPVAEEASEQEEQNSQAARDKAAEKSDQASEVAEEVSTYGKQISQETTGTKIQPNRESEPTEPATKDKASTLQPQASEKASELTNKLKEEAASKKEAVQKQVEDKLQDEKGRSKSSVEKSSAKSEEQPTQADNRSNNSFADDQAGKKEELQPVEPEDEPASGNNTSQLSDSGDDISQVDNKQNTVSNEDNHTKEEQPLSSPEPREDPIAQIHMINPTSFPSPVSSSGGDLGSQSTISLIVKGNLPGTLIFFTSDSQTIGKRSELLRDQWVNAPPAEPPKMAS